MDLFGKLKTAVNAVRNEKAEKTNYTPDNKGMSDAEIQRCKNMHTVKIKIVSLIGLAIVLIICTVAWFTMNEFNHISGVDMTDSDMPFELQTNGTDEKLNKALLNKLEYKYGESIADSKNSTSDNVHQIYWLMNDESNMYNDKPNSKGINPGTNGSLTFYVVPKTDEKLEISFNLNISAYSNKDNELTAVDDDNVLNFINGHIMFFQKYDKSNGYSDLIQNCKFNVTIDNAEAGKEYPVTIYWVWPDTLGQYLLQDSDINLSGDQICKDDISRKNFAKEMTKNYNKYFETKNNNKLVENDKLSDIYSAALENMVDGKYKLSYFSALSMAYNDADEIIGTNVNTLLIQLNAELK